ncbi:Cyanovirin-N [Echria macrotheca]|uniref:Cyanovirin-N n=1 Tax=Echria macrotheca TaxID=438768 RepID=A0AAJ0BJE3_9PEZI|nr:Cyanovirin-N [Echria macrotheca]
MKFLSLFVLAAAGTGVLAEDGGFITSCDGSTIKVSGKYLTAKCKNILGTVACSKLDLSQCLKNSYGLLDTDPIGAGPHFSDKNQCVNCSTDPSTSGFIVGGSSQTLLHCQCNSGTGASQANWPVSFFDLDTLVSNNNGVLECFKTKATKC